jgi:hypothetical protein
MRRILLAVAILSVTALAVAAYAAARPVMKTHQYRCTDRNQSLYFLIYEQDGKLNGGHFYVDNMQVGVLTAEQAGTDVIKAGVVGNTANVAFQLRKSGSVMVANYQTSNRTEVCKASYKYQ